MHAFKLTLIALLGLFGCTRYATPELELKKGDKALIGSVKISPDDGLMQGLPESMFLKIAPVVLKKDAKGNLHFAGEKRADSYTIKSAWQKPTLTTETPFFIPIKAGVYVLKGVEFDYVGSFYEMPIESGVPFIVSAESDATYMGRVIILLNRKNATSTLKTETESKIKSMYLEKNPTHKITDLPLSVK